MDPKLKIVLPWPNPELSPNARIHWAKKKNLIYAARTEAFYETKNQIEINVIDEAKDLLKNRNNKIEINYLFLKNKKGQQQDIDNLIASMKSSLDGIFDALESNDKRIHKMTGNKIFTSKNSKVIVLVRILR